MQNNNDVNQNHFLWDGTKYMLSLVLGVVTIIFTGFLISCAWNWFIVDRFQVRSINTVDGIAVNLLLTTLALPFTLHAAYQRAKDQIEMSPSTWAVVRNLSTVVIALPIYLGIMWIWHQFI